MEIDGRSVKMSDSLARLHAGWYDARGKYRVCIACPQHTEFHAELPRGCTGDLDLH